MSDELAFTPALALAARVRAREVSPVELAELYLERIERLDPQLNAYVTVDAEGALAAARAAESAASDAPFHGVPTSIKDLNETAGLRTTYSTKAYAANVPAFDAAVVRRIREAGFVVLGKTYQTCPIRARVALCASAPTSGYRRRRAVTRASRRRPPTSAAR